MPGAYLGVDFFFLLSGYLLVRHFDNTIQTGSLGDDWFAYIKHRLIGIYPEYFIILLATVLIDWRVSYTGIINFVKGVWQTLDVYKWDFFFLHYIGMDVPMIIRSIWFLSPLVIVSFGLYAAMLSNRDKLVYIYSPILAIGGFVYCYNTFGTLAMQGRPVWFTNGAVLRALFEMCAGIIAYEINKRIIKLQYSRSLRVILITVELVLIYLVGCQIIWHKYNDFFFIIVFMYIIIVSFAEIFPVGRFCNNKFCYVLGEISYPLFLCHLSISRLGQKVQIQIDNRYLNLLVYVSVSIIVAFLINFLGKRMKRLFEREKIEK